MKTPNQILIYTMPDGEGNVEVFLSEENLWMSQSALANLFQTSSQNITMHIKHIYEEDELAENRTCKSGLQVQIEGERKVKREIKLYNLEMIIALGFRTKSSIGNTFRIWANRVIKEYMTKGFVLNDKRLEDPTKFGKDYFDELLLRIRAIRASERRFYQKIIDIYSMSIDYKENSEQTVLFFKTVQNKLHFAITGETAAEFVYERADAKKDNMGLTSWNGEHVSKSDVVIAKNYLSKKEINALNQIVNMYLDHAERMAQSGIQMHMSDWEKALNEFLKFERADILEGPGKISRFLAEQKALQEYELFDANRQISLQNDLSIDCLAAIEKKAK